MQWALKKISMASPTLRPGWQAQSSMDSTSDPSWRQELHWPHSRCLQPPWLARTAFNYGEWLGELSTSSLIYSGTQQDKDPSRWNFHLYHWPPDAPIPVMSGMRTSLVLSFLKQLKELNHFMTKTGAVVMTQAGIQGIPTWKKKCICIIFCIQVIQH